MAASLLCTAVDLSMRGWVVNMRLSFKKTARMNKIEKAAKPILDTPMASRKKSYHNWLILLLKAIERCFRPASRKRSLKIRLKKQTKDVIIEKEVEYRDEY